MADMRLMSVAILIGTVLMSGCFDLSWDGNNTNHTYQTNQTAIEYVNCTARQPSLITSVEYSPDHETPSYLRQISEYSGEQVSLNGTVKTRVLAQGTRSEWWYDYFEADDGIVYILNGRHWSGYPNFEYGNFYTTTTDRISITGQKVTIYPMGKDETSYGEYGPQDGILITSVDGYEPMCCHQKLESGGYSPLICLWN